MKHISELAQDYETSVRDGNGPAIADRPIAQMRQMRDSYATRPQLEQLDTSHPGVRRMVDAVHVWRERYYAACDPDNQEPPRAPSLVLSGPNGTGKTHAARAIYWGKIRGHVDENGNFDYSTARPVSCWFDAADLILKMAPIMTEWRTSEYASVGHIVGSAPYVVVDDLGGEGIIPFVATAEQSFERQARWFRFIDFCYDRQVPVIITTNLDIQSGALAEWIGRRAWDRLSEMAPLGQMVGLWDVPSWRVKAGGR